MKWNTVTGHTIYTEAGLNVLNVRNNEAIKYNKENLLNYFFIVKA